MKLNEKIDAIHKRFQVATATERTILEQRLDKYDEVWVQLAQSAVRQTGSKIKGTKAWPPIFAHKGAICQYWNQRIQNFHVTGKLKAEQLCLPPKYVPPTITCKDELHDHHANALKEWHIVKVNAADLRV